MAVRGRRWEEEEDLKDYLCGDIRNQVLPCGCVSSILTIEQTNSARTTYVAPDIIKYV